MRTVLVLSALVIAAGSAQAGGKGSRSHGANGAHPRAQAQSYTPSPQSDHYVAPTVRSDGRFVQGHMRTDPNSTRLHNYSTKGNVNPYTGQSGTKDPHRY